MPCALRLNLAFGSISHIDHESLPN